MTREERNTKLKHFITCLKCEVSGKECDDNCSVQYEAGNMGEVIENLEAISKALEQEPCEDAISRRAVRDTIYAECSGHKLDIDFAKVLLLQRAIKALPPVNPQPCTNAISRSDMLDAIGHGTTYTSEDLQKIIKGLPPVNPLAKDYNTIYYTPQPKTGHWQHYEGMLICSECRTEFYDDIMEYCGDDAPKWCPDCGTKMIEPQESEG